MNRCTVRWFDRLTLVRHLETVTVAPCETPTATLYCFTIRGFWATFRCKFGRTEVIIRVVPAKALQITLYN